jgi:septal ring factor EnvC (AmiA/AmiB activator)
LIPKDLVKSSIEEKEKNISKINQKLLEKNQKLKTLMKTNNQLKKKLN